ncbi:MAG: hypothetical protein EBY17_06900 [Acidobacteriia bacterium]|nr:hypothetical protein [Terriglobia bacterium]
MKSAASRTGSTTAKDARRRRILEEAWIGDAVLSLWARRYVLREVGVLDAPRFERMTSNQFLVALGDPSEVEAQIGRTYEDSGLEAAFAWLDTHILPLHLKQEAKRPRKRDVPLRNRLP